MISNTLHLHVYNLSTIHHYLTVNEQGLGKALADNVCIVLFCLPNQALGHQLELGTSRQAWHTPCCTGQEWDSVCVCPNKRGQSLHDLSSCSMCDDARGDTIHRSCRKT